MVQLQSPSGSEVVYPESDGKPMADNTKQFRWIVTLQQNLEWLFANDPDVFVAGDLLWYPVEGDNKTSTAPDVMVVLGRPKGDRGSYQQWKEANQPPQVVFEILSPGNTRSEMNRKLLFYNQFGVDEYYLYDPDQNLLSGWQRREGLLDCIESMAGWVSLRLQIRFDLSGDELQIFRPDGEKFLSYGEIARRAEQEHERAEQEHERAEQERQRAEQAEARARLLEQRLREMGVELE